MKKFILLIVFSLILSFVFCTSSLAYSAGLNLHQVAENIGAKVHDRGPAKGRWRNKSFGGAVFLQEPDLRQGRWRDI